MHMQVALVKKNDVCMGEDKHAQGPSQSQEIFPSLRNA